VEAAPPAEAAPASSSAAAAAAAAAAAPQEQGPEVNDTRDDTAESSAGMDFFLGRTQAQCGSTQGMPYAPVLNSQTQHTTAPPLPTQVRTHVPLFVGTICGTALITWRQIRPRPPPAPCRLPRSVRAPFGRTSGR
jgi:hypothetical protein